MGCGRDSKVFRAGHFPFLRNGSGGKTGEWGRRQKTEDRRKKAEGGRRKAGGGIREELQIIKKMLTMARQLCKYKVKTMHGRSIYN
jgi:hypothetical protein